MFAQMCTHAAMQATSPSVNGVGKRHFPSDSSFDEILEQLSMVHHDEISQLRDESANLRRECEHLRVQTKMYDATKLSTIREHDFTPRSLVSLPSTPRTQLQRVEPHARSPSRELWTGDRLAFHEKGISFEDEKGISFEEDKHKSIQQVGSDTGTVSTLTSDLCNHLGTAVTSSATSSRTLVAAFASDPSNSVALDPRVSLWSSFVERMMSNMAKYHVLRKTWIVDPSVVNKVIRQAGSDLDLGVLSPEKQSSKRKATIFGGLPNDKLKKAEEMRGAIFEKKKCSQRRFICDPQQPSRLGWMMLGMGLLVFDVVVLPMQVFPLPENKFLTFMQWFQQVFWTMDIVVSFFTAVYINSELRYEFKVIARVYMTGWFALDLLVVVPLWLVEFMDSSDDSSGGARSTGALKLIRFMRFLRLARLAKFEHFMQEALAAVNSSSLLLCVGIGKSMMMMIIVSHVNACAWYLVGKQDGNGWTERYADTSVPYRYLTSMHWAFTQFQGTSEVVPKIGKLGERAYAVCGVTLAMIILACFVSSLTNNMMQLQALHEERSSWDHATRKYLSSHNISRRLSIRVRKYVSWRFNQKGGQDQEKILDVLPRMLAMDLMEEVRGPVVKMHDLFLAYSLKHGRVFRQLCHQELRLICPSPEEIVFTEQDVCQKMYFMVKGIAVYIRNVAVHAKRKSASAAREEERSSIEEKLLEAERTYVQDQGVQNAPSEDQAPLRRIRSGHQLCEPCLWTFWEHCGSMLSHTEVELVTLHTDSFAQIVSANPPTHVATTLYARQFVAGLNRFGAVFNDIVDLRKIAHLAN